jgi:hypothetical protein
VIANEKAACKGHLGPGYDAAWLTPLLTEREAAEPLLSYPASEFVVIGSSDPYLSRDVFDVLPGTSLVVPGDQILRVPDDPAAMVASHEQSSGDSTHGWRACSPETRHLAVYRAIRLCRDRCIPRYIFRRR